MSWQAVGDSLDARGWARIRGFLSPAECAALIDLYGRDERFRKTISMDQHRFGSGEYRYFAYPLPRLVARLRTGFYRALSDQANRWAERLRLSQRYPRAQSDYRSECAAAGQLRPTPLLLRYQSGGYNRMHQDLYGDLSFPLQVVFPLSRQRIDYDGGELLISEQAPRMQSRVTALSPDRGDAIIFPNAVRPVPGSRGDYRLQVRHGASTITRGERYALGLIFHDAL